MNQLLRELRKELGLTQTQVAKELNMTYQNYQKYENNEVQNIPFKTLLKISKLYKVSLDYLSGNTKDKTGKETQGIKIPVLGYIPAGIPIEAIQQILDYEEIDEKLALSGEFFALQVQGDSMTPRICPKDVVIVKKQADCNTGDVCAVMINGDNATLKQIKKENSGIWLTPYNTAYSPAFYTNQQIRELPIKILGVVIELRGKFK